MKYWLLFVTAPLFCAPEDTAERVSQIIYNEDNPEFKRVFKRALKRKRVSPALRQKRELYEAIVALTAASPVTSDASESF